MNLDLTNLQESKHRLERKKASTIVVLLFVIVIAFGFYAFFSFNKPVKDFPLNQIITIPAKSSAKKVAQLLQEQKLIQSSQFALFVGSIMGTTNNLVAGEYMFNKPVSTIEVMKRVGVGHFGIERVKITLLEGWTNKQFAEKLGSELPLFNQQEFLDSSKELEGTLFPDTYFFPRTAKADDVIKKLTENFNKKTEKVLEQRTGLATDKTLSEIIIMASLLEKEATNKEDAAMISDILWSRIKGGMPLQVDATLGYLLDGKTSAQLTKADLGMDSPYNTYKYKGLPIGPIGNPGMDMIVAAANPVQNDFVYYLHDKEGNPYYAKTFKEHVANKFKYLK